MENITRRKFKSRMDAKQDVWRAIPALMGDGNGTVEIPGQPNYVYIRVGDGDLGQAFNNRCQLRDNLAIYVGYDPITDPDRRIFQVLSVRMADYAGAGFTTVPNVGPHHTTHEYGGGDDVYIEWRRLMGLRVGRPALFVVTVDPGYIYRAGAWMAIPSTTVDLTATHAALVAAQAQYVLISLSSTGVVTATPGAVVGSIILLTIADCPTPPVGHIPLAAVRLYKIQTTIGDVPSAPDIIDLRFPTYNAMSGFATPGGLDTYVQYNDGGVLGGSALFTFNDASGDVQVVTLTSTALTASTLVYSNAGKVITSLANAAGYLYNNGAGALSYVAAPLPGAHNILDSTYHGDTLTGAVTDGDVIIGNVTPKWSRLAIAIPAANVRNVLGIDNGELRPSWKTALDAVAPTTIAESAVAASGTSLLFAHRDHTHGAPATWAATAHNVLDSTYHGDVLTGAIARGDLLYGNATPKIARLALGGAAGSFVTRDANDVIWSGFYLAGSAGRTYTFPDYNVSFPAADAHGYLHSDGAGTLTWDAGATAAHDLLSATHTDTLADGVVDGDVIIGNVTPVWSRLAIAIPAANVRNVLGIDNGELRPSWKTTLDAVDPTTIVESHVPDSGTSLFYSHRDHTHGAPATWDPKEHNILVAKSHGDSIDHSVVRGDMIIANSTPKWSALAVATAFKILTTDGTDVAWSDFSVRGTTGGITVLNVTANKTLQLTCAGDYNVTIGGPFTITGGGVLSTLTLPAASTTITGGGTLALGGYTLTVPATGTAALISITNTFSTDQTIASTGPTLQIHRTGAGTSNAVIQWMLNSVVSGYWGIAGDTDGLITGAAQGDLVMRGNAKAVLFSTDSGANALMTFVASNGGVIIGAATGGGKGAGTLNTAGDIYKNNSAYTNPDYALEQWATGSIKQFADRPGAADYRRMTLGEIERHIKEHLRLPRMTSEPSGIFERADMVLEKLEELYTYIIEFGHRLDTLEIRQ